MHQRDGFGVSGRSVGLGAVALGGARAINFVVLLGGIPLTIGYLGADRVGVWAAASALVALAMGLGDFGIGNGVISRVATAHASGNLQREHAFVSASYLILTVVAVGGMALGAAAIGVFPLGAAVGGTGDLHGEASVTVAVILIGVFLTVPMTLSERLLFGLGRSSLAGVFRLAGASLGLLAFVVAAHLEAPVPALVAAQLAGPFVAYATETLLTFSRLVPELCPRPGLVTRGELKAAARSGAAFAVLQAATLVTLYGDLILVSVYLGPGEAATYAVAQRLIFIGPIAMTLFFMPLWGAYARAWGQGRVNWLRKAHRATSAIAVMAVAVVSAVMLFAGPQAAELLGDGELEPSRSLFMALGLWAIVYILTVATSLVLNAIDDVPFQARTFTWTVALSVIVAAGAVNAVGLLGPPVSFALVQVATLLPVLNLRLARKIRVVRSERSQTPQGEASAS